MYEINVKLQGNKMNIIKAKGIISSFIAKFDIYKSNIGRKELMQFPTLRKCSMADIVILENKILIFTDQLDQLKTDMESRFKDLMKLEIPDWIFDPFCFEVVDKLTSSLQTEFLDLKYAKVVFKKYGYELAWVKLMDTYPQLWKQTDPLLISLPSIYLVERGFSSVIQPLTKQRNRLDICFKGDLRPAFKSDEHKT
ncbi:protein FAM200C-like [Parasteatoda tepidariorum]|uniref:protein FAM200C-like n=1 Tax=Parasteatoda tepidariorum TaxID=114398 RepID=UPI001C7221E6|nr:general transcription factor II-I repeat domain-containing protein 2B-like [Parasteatoda tepidariorum]